MDEPRVTDGGTVGPVDAVQVPRYSGLATFARLPRLEDVPDYDIAVVGAPFDSGVSYRPGARFGPSAIRQGSRLLRPYNPAQDVSPFAGTQVVDAGDLAVNPFDIEAAIGQVAAGLAQLVGGRRRAVLLGGDHTIALPALRVMKDKHGPVALVHFDAHLDTWDTYYGAPYTHGTPFRRAWEEGLLLADHCLHVGTRGPLYSSQDLVEDASFGFRVIECRDLDREGIDAVVQRIRRRVADAPVYVSIDIDVLDPAHAPGTGTPEMGGLSGRELLELVRGLAGLDLVGADVVEVAPAYDHAEITAIAGANLVYELVCLLAAGRR
ncbi:MAG: agmatinase [Actinomycetota bacterium]|nr:agmatinase [Actinomycetota bacterium]MDH5277639.1 agmatinase [Actinomycetota bacterium]